MKKITPKALLVSWILAVVSILWTIWATTQAQSLENLYQEEMWNQQSYETALKSSEWFDEYVTDIWKAENYDWIINFMKEEWWVKITDQDLAEPFLKELQNELSKKDSNSSIEYVAIIWSLIVALWLWTYYVWKKRKSNKK